MGSILVQVIEQKALIPEEQVEEVQYFIVVLVMSGLGISVYISNVVSIFSRIYQVKKSFESAEMEEEEIARQIVDAYVAKGLLTNEQIRELLEDPELDHKDMPYYKKFEEVA